jgi:toxin secretion/phage lysis holin
MLNLKMQAIKAGTSTVLALLLKCLGKNYKIVSVLICFMLADTLLGWLGAAKTGVWCSRNARWGVVGKLVELIIIALMYLCEWAFCVDWMIGAVTLYFLICEAASIVENIVNYGLNANIPASLITILQSSRSSLVSDLIKRISEIFNNKDGENK